MLDFSVTFIITIVDIVILFFVLRVILFRPVTKFMAERAKKIQDAINQAERDKNQAKQLLEQYEGQLKNAEAEAEEIIRAAREIAAREAARITADGKDAAETMLANARRQLEAEQQAALAKFRAEAVMLTLAASSKLIGRDMRQDDNRHFVNMLLDELSLQQKRNG
jgi:F-type H+-transporting ATPase subunit b